MKLNKAADLATAVVVMIALAAGATAGWGRLVTPWLENRPVRVEGWQALLQGGRLIGDSLSPLVIVEFGDYQCPGCRLFEQRLNAFRAANPGTIAVKYRHWPLSYHAVAYPAARAAECAASQERFEAFHEQLMSETAWMNDPDGEFVRLAAVVGIPDSLAFRRCISDADPLPAVEADIDLARSIGGKGTPTLVINGKLLRVMPDSALLAVLLTEALAMSDGQPSGIEAAATRIEPASSEMTGAESLDLSLEQWRVSSQPNLTLGRAEGPKEELFHNVMGVAQMPDGKIAVVDAGTSHIMFFDNDGEHIVTVGGEGDGPQEFRFPRLLPANRYDSLVVAGISRLSVIRSNGEVDVLGTYTPPDLPRAVLPGGIVYQHSFDLGKRVTQSGPRPSDSELGILDLRDGGRVALGRFTYSTTYIDRRDDGRQSPFIMPLRAGLSVAPRAGGLAAVVGNESVVRLFDSRSFSNSIALPLRPRKVTAQVIESVVTEIVEERPSEERRRVADVMSRMPFPSDFPFVSGVLPDESGGVWVKLDPEYLGGNRPPMWIALDESGGVLAQVETPKGLEIFQIGLDFIVGVTRDALGVQRIQRYDLSRESALSPDS